MSQKVGTIDRRGGFSVRLSSREIHLNAIPHGDIQRWEAEEYIKKNRNTVHDAMIAAGVYAVMVGIYDERQRLCNSIITFNSASEDAMSDRTNTDRSGLMPRERRRKSEEIDKARYHAMKSQGVVVTVRRTFKGEEYTDGSAEIR